jgi:membrane protease YdiL (CAAX protease family)
VLSSWLFYAPPAPGGAATGIASLTAAAPSVAARVYSDLGAGVYEEFLFRLVLISLALLLMVDVFSLPRGPAATAAVIIGGILFALYHFTMPQLTGAQPFPFRLFVFFSLAGMYLGCLFVFRGYGIAVGAHALYNVAVSLLMRPQ